MYAIFRNNESCCVSQVELVVKRRDLVLYEVRVHQNASHALTVLTTTISKPVKINYL